eukprot:3401292-Prymnesium_polylepis.1
MRIGDFVQYDYVGPPMAGPYWQTSDHDSQWGVGCGGFSLRDRAKAILMCNTPRCVTPAAGKLEDQQLGAGWKHIEKRCTEAGITVQKPSRHLAARFGMEYDLYMDVLPGEDPSMPEGCRAKFHTCAKYDPGMWRRPPELRIPKWNPQPKPANVQCERPHCARRCDTQTRGRRSPAPSGACDRAALRDPRAVPSFAPRAQRGPVLPSPYAH